ncbi:hypothetical protein Agabi119p4_2757 [Agaricus bisporus var. burnettii]|uniref:SIS domain-containing protein n=1 Tax=Agaricus bisporus var. burnettii TaxID=192524 RepID=A0A8H7F5S8_AGABI|nr:hypothetical protein Agabi119p4_2757 [Agaricus bisporus var. burnettii]
MAVNEKSSSLRLASLQTEGRNVRSSNIDIVSTLEMCRIINSEDRHVAEDVGRCIHDIAAAIDQIADRVREGGRLIYIGAGTSGRLGILDASEIPPTFSAPHSQFVGIMAGGDIAIRKSVENAEDSPSRAEEDLASLDPPLSRLDSLIGIATSGRTPYVLGGLSHAKSLGVLTIGICCVKPSEMEGKCDHLIECVVGSEVVTGSTRLKAGTATKLILNMLSTGVMIRIGKTYGNLMVDVKPSNMKLQDRAIRIFRTVLPETTLSDLQIDDLFKACQYNVKLAIVVEHHKCTVPEATTLLDHNGGVLKLALRTPVITSKSSSAPAQTPATKESLVVCIDAGGTKCKAVIANRDGIIGQGESGPCNFATLGHDLALSALENAVISALSDIANSSLVTPVLPPEKPIFAGVWIGGAGLDRAADLASIRPRIASLLNLLDDKALIVTNDATLLSSAIIASQHSNSNQSNISSCVVLITGTGAFAHSYILPTNKDSSLPIPFERSSGWGYLLGDEGSAFAIGRDVIRAALDRRDCGHEPTSLDLAILNHFGCKTVKELLSAIYLDVPPLPLDGQDPSTVDADPKLRVAGVCRLVFSHAFPSSSSVTQDQQAMEMIQRSASSAAVSVIPLINNNNRKVDPATSVLVFGGALAQIDQYRNMIVDALRARGHVFARLECVRNAAEVGVGVLVRDFLA